jgi:hypothetical protein
MMPRFPIVVFQIPGLQLLLIIAFGAKQVSSQNNTNECLVPGDPDVLGLGVRLGFYFQLFSNLLLGTIRPNDAANAFLINVFFIIALVCAAIYSSAKGNFPPGSIIACTWYPALAYVALIPFLFRPLPRNLPYSLVILCAAVFMGTSCFAVWFWYKGLDAEHPHQCMDPRVFLFFNCSAVGNIRTVFKVLALALLVLGIVSGWSIHTFVVVALSLPGNSSEVSEFGHRVFALGFIWLALSIVASELQLRWNHIVGTNAVDTTGQIIPLTLGVLSVVQAMFAFKDVVKRVGLESIAKSQVLMTHIVKFIHYFMTGVVKLVRSLTKPKQGGSRN